MSFESGGDMENPFEDADDEGDDTQADESVEMDIEDTQPVEDDESTNNTTGQASSTTRRDDLRGAGSGQESETKVDYISDLECGRRYSNERLARALMRPEYHSESPPVPYATWRDGTSTARDRTTLELNPDVDNLVRKAQTEFEDRYGTNITKADLREFAMVYGLAHLDDIFEMAEEWGIQYDN
ncbi:hypothetical protein [Halobaculum sp. EA56]|uniref:hypothetical protein n=1 Tax=Halobaculum sp. EA56 TaxID=3421648 RepID=UPI003EB9F03A